MELVRPLARAILGYRSPIYRVASAFADLFYVVKCEGLSGLKFRKLAKRDGPGDWHQFKRLRHPIFVRPGTKDVDSIIDNVFREEWGRLPHGLSPEYILDAGAYIGDTAAYFLSRFEKAKVIALEPNPENRELARENLALYKESVKLIPKALWISTDGVLLKGSGTGAHIVDQGGAVIESTTVCELMQKEDVAKWDLVKLDIEGAELQVLRDGADTWLENVKCLIVETHGNSIARSVTKLMRDNGFDVSRHRNVWYCINYRCRNK